MKTIATIFIILSILSFSSICFSTNLNSIFSYIKENGEEHTTPIGLCKFIQYIKNGSKIYLTLYYNEDKYPFRLSVITEEWKIVNSKWHIKSIIIDYNTLIEEITDFSIKEIIETTDNTVLDIKYLDIIGFDPELYFDIIIKFVIHHFKLDKIPL